MNYSRIVLFGFITTQSIAGFSASTKNFEYDFLIRKAELLNDLVPDTTAKKVNLNGADIVPVITFPGIAQQDFQDAFNVLSECTVEKVPLLGFKYPFVAPGGQYGSCWWQLDESIALQGTKWVNQGFSENVLRGFIGVQKPDGRIPLWGNDKVEGYPECSSLPKLFSAAYAVLKQSGDKALIRETYSCLKKYLDWWFTVRQDHKTGLISGVFEESFPPFENQLKNTAQVDLNVEVVAGCDFVAKLAKETGNSTDYQKYTKLGSELKSSINKYMWNETDGAYYAYQIRDDRLDNKLICYTFDPFRLQIAPKARIPSMIKMLTDNAYFNWENNAVTSAAKTDKIYNETIGGYNGNPAWSGDIWSLRNEAIIQGLEDIGRYDMASYLSMTTIRLFNANYYEFLKPSDGSGHGVKRYAWSAAQYINILIENTFGIDYNRFTKTITICPNLDESLSGKSIALEKLLLPDGNRLSVYISKKSGVMEISYSITGNERDMNIVVAVPKSDHTNFRVVDKSGSALKTTKHIHGVGTLTQISNGKRYADALQFIEQK